MNDKCLMPIWCRKHGTGRCEMKRKCKLIVHKPGTYEAAESARIGGTMKTIYAVNSGSYSDYRVEALFSSRKLAEEFMALIKYNDYNDIEEYQLDPPAVDLIRRGYSVWRVHMLKDGTTERVDRTDNEKYDISGAGGHAIWERTKAPAYQGKGIPDILTSSVWAKTEKQAVKIVNEKRVQMIAAGKFI